MEYRLKAYSILEFGKRKDANGAPHQEDSIYPTQDNLSNRDRLFILCDGMGGHDAGEIASATVCQTMSDTINKLEPNPYGRFTDEDFDKALDAAYDALDAKDTGAAKKMGTTMTMLKLHDNGATIAHIGDSRVYQIRPGKNVSDTKILFQTADHSLVNDLLRAGEITQEEARVFPQKNVITRAMQPAQDRRCKATVAHITDIKAGDFFYLCSDGMLEDDSMDNGNRLKEIFSKEGGPASQKVKTLISETIDNKDNHSAFIIEIVDVTGTATPIMPPTHGYSRQLSDRDFGMSQTNAQVKHREGLNTTKKDNKLSKNLIWIGACVLLLAFITFTWLIPNKNEVYETIPLENSKSTDIYESHERYDYRPERENKKVQRRNNNGEYYRENYQDYYEGSRQRKEYSKGNESGAARNNNQVNHSQDRVRSNATRTVNENPKSSNTGTSTPTDAHNQAGPSNSNVSPNNNSTHINPGAENNKNGAVNPSEKTPEKADQTSAQKGQEAGGQTIKDNANQQNQNGNENKSKKSEE